MLSKPENSSDSGSGDEVEWAGDIYQEKDMYMLLHLPETSIQDSGPSERPYENHVKSFEHEAELHCLLERDDSGRHSLDSRSVSNYTTDITENHCSTADDHQGSDTASPARSAKEQHAELCLHNSTRPYQYHLQENPVTRTMRRHPPLIKSLSSGSMPRRHTLVSSIDGPNRCIKNDAISRYTAMRTGGGPTRRSHSNSDRRESARFHNEVRRLVVEMRSVQMRLLQLNEKPEMIYYV